MGRTGKSNVERRSVEKRPSLRSKLRLPWKELQGSWEVCLFFWFLLLSPWTPASRGSPMETPSQNCHTMLLPNNGTAIGQVWNKPSSDFSQCVDQEQGSGEKNYLSFFIIQGITHPLQRTRSRQLWGCKASGPKPAGTSEGVFSVSARLKVCALLVLAPAEISLAPGNGNF